MTHKPLLTMRTRHNLTYQIVILLLLASGCSKPIEMHNDSGTANPAQSSPPNPNGFTVKLVLSNHAREALLKNKETIIMVGDVTGDSKPRTPERFRDGNGELDLGMFTREISPGQDIQVNHVELRRVAVPYLEGEPRLLINLFSGRKSSKDNLLDCNIFQGALASALNKHLSLNCWLIGERMQENGG
jgi:hypothetical protein